MEKSVDGPAKLAGHNLETHNILVFQGDFEREEAQGFSISSQQPYAIILSSGDYPNARSFTLFHELGHLLLSEGCLSYRICQTRSEHQNY